MNAMPPVEKRKRALISGASIAGPATAFWLHKAGYEVTIVEQAPGIRKGGYTVDMRGISRKVAEKMGILDKIWERKNDLKSADVVDKHSRVLASMSADFLGGQGPVSDLEIMRGDLAQILYDLTKNTTHYIFGDSITAIKDTSEGAYVTFEKGNPQTFDFVIGADGAHSNVRAKVFGSEAKFVQPLGYYVSIFTIPNYLKLDRKELLYNIPGGKVVGIHNTAHDETTATVMFYFASPPLRYDYHDVRTQKRLLAKAFENEKWEVPTLLGAMYTAPDFFFDSMNLIKMDSWSKGNVTLVGDAAYCPSALSGQGTNLALVGAYVLGGELANAGGDHQKAFRAYEATMREYVAEIQASAKSSAALFVPKSRIALWLRNLSYRVILHTPLEKIIAKKMQEPHQTAAIMKY